MAPRRLTDRFVEAVKPPKEGRDEHWDASLPGFGLRVSAPNKRTSRVRKSWVLLYWHGRQKRRMTLGTYPALSLADARTDAKSALGRVAYGEDPASEKQQQKGIATFRELADEYIERHAKLNKRSWFKDRAMLDKDVLPAIGSKAIPNVTRHDIITILDQMVDRGAAIQANRTFEVVRKVFNWGMGRGLVDNNPCVGVKKPVKEIARERVLTDEELVDFWFGLDDAPMSKLVRLALRLQIVTLARKGEVVGAPWGEFDTAGKTWTVTAERSKNGRSHRVPLVDLALGLLEEIRETSGESDWLFPSPRGKGAEPINGAAVSHAVRNSLKALRVADVTPHDLRRSGASKMAELGVPRLVIAKVLNHVSADRGVTGVYDRHSYDAEKREALELWGRRLRTLLATRERKNVVVLGTGSEAISS